LTVVAAQLSSKLHRGEITAFDARRGWGSVTDVDGTAFEFHATSIADGSRQIDLGKSVAFLVAPGHRGRYEARSITVLDA
jgi:cold shock CspA family protein